MSDRKQQVIKMAHQLFIEKGFQATSIQDIIDYCGIAKGTFYNYFSSKNELLIAIFTEAYTKMEKERNKILIGQDHSNIQLFIKQIEFQMYMNRKNKMVALFEEVLVSHDEELKQFIKEGQLRLVQWVYLRFIQLFGEEKKTYLLDCAIMFIGILHQNIKYADKRKNADEEVHKVVHYSVNRIVKVVEEVAESGEQLHEPSHLDSWLSKDKRADQTFRLRLTETITSLRKRLKEDKDQVRYIELIDFIQDEISHSHHPRKMLIESSLASLKNVLSEKELVEELENILNTYIIK
ncbi:AcrR family transcriptional regulator [Salirhabdus euzebyi]|uniref:AcrR family transcriptional regulator n=1 Tax=Salirhabdus euzebyi TaxID=394506 RepID=A0A841PUI9_9BACI|nr:TetR/AcrR family transcriptional regulator [Salirhabdus euzebyi]MBB6452470.1 AcrR family transcriptional regulator [Salirhabdus euzebyi]